MFYVRDDGDELQLMATVQTDMRGTWRHWRDGDGREWKSRGLGLVRWDAPTAVCAFAESNADRLRPVLLLLWKVSFDEGVEVGKQEGRDACRRACPLRGRSFLRRLITGRPFAAV